jgi:hypothetical protein
MAHWAEIDKNNVVVRVTVGDNNDPNGDEGYQWLIDNLGGKWVKTSYNGNIRKNFAGIGFTYDKKRDAFIPPNPYPSWILVEETCLWEAPKPQPKVDGVAIAWKESTQEWSLAPDSGPWVWDEANQIWVD